MQPYPVLISIPHGGTTIPHELEHRVALSPQDLFNDSDAFTREIYDIGDAAIMVIKAEVARAFIDLNRAKNDLPPANPDGAIKSMTCYGVPVYRKGQEPDKTLRQHLLKQYYAPYHDRLRDCTASSNILLALDCHSMAAQPPPISPDYGKNTPPRPMICLGNARGQACDFQTVELLAACFREGFALNENEVTINTPFAGGFITRNYGNHPLPWIQVELNRALYLSSPWFDAPSLTVNHRRLNDLKLKFLHTLDLFFNRKYGILKE